ncbi:MAG TPA: hypothetical protein VLZ75_04500 [Chitinophagales bacterium]|nr:hypothetical protein [Chitinophagales bacterium]
MKVCLVVIYNHRYEKNITPLNKYYKDRFDDIFHVIPFYQSDDDKVITVYENSHQFNGYIAQAFKSFYHDEFTHYVFAGDDLILHPDVNQNNIIEGLGLTQNSSYIKKLHPLSDVSIPWYHIPKVLYRFVSHQGVETEHELPNKEEAEGKALKNNITQKKMSLKSFLKHVFVFKTPMTFFRTVLYTMGYMYVKRFKNLLELPYPFVAGYSDFFIVSKSSVRDFCHYCGVFAGMNIFVEVAIPTALMLSSTDIKFENKKFRGVEIWNPNKVNELMQNNKASIKELFKNHPDKLYFHPVKLSTWKFDKEID